MRWNWGSEVVTFVNVVIVVVVVQQAYDVVVTDDVVVVVVVEHHHRKVDWAGVTKSHQPLNGNNRLSEPPNQTPNVFAVIPEKPRKQLLSDEEKRREIAENRD